MKPYRAAIGLASMLAAAACQREHPKPVLVERTPVPAARPTPSSALTRAPLSDAAFVPKTGACRAPYEEVLATCVHKDYRARVSRSELQYQLALYRRGASSPRSDGTITGAASAAPVALDPSALSVSKAEDESARDVTEARIKALDDVLTSVRESVLSSRVERLGMNASAPATPTTADTTSPARSANGGLRLADEDNIAGPPDDALGAGASAEANVARSPDRALSLDERAGPDAGSSALRERMVQIRQIQTFLDEMPLEQRETILRKLESSGARNAVGDDTWSELVRR